MAIVYNGNQSINSEITEFNRLLAFFLSDDVRSTIKAKAVYNLFQRLSSLIRKFETENDWVNRIASDTNEVKFSINRRQILGNLTVIIDEIKHLENDRSIPDLLRNEVSNTKKDAIKLYELHLKLTINVENWVNQGWKNTILQNVEVSAAIFCKIGLFMAGGSALVYGGGLLASASNAINLGLTMAKLGSFAFFGGATVRTIAEQLQDADPIELRRVEKTT